MARDSDLLKDTLNAVGKHRFVTTISYICEYCGKVLDPLEMDEARKTKASFVAFCKNIGIDCIGAIKDA